MSLFADRKKELRKQSKLMLRGAEAPLKRIAQLEQELAELKVIKDNGADDETFALIVRLREELADRREGEIIWDKKCAKLEQELAEAKAKLLSISINDLPEKDREYEELEKERDQLRDALKWIAKPDIGRVETWEMRAAQKALEQTDE